MNDIIAAIGTPIGEGGVSIIRFSGTGALELAQKLFRTSSGKPPREILSRKVHVGAIHDPVTGDCIDEVILIWFQAPKSYTGEDVIEINAHGGIFVSSRILGLILDHGARPAEPGEFTRRAFINGRIDLSQAEAVADLISASSDKALQSAMRQLKGHLSKKLNDLYDRLLSVTSHIEAAIDFPEEGLNFQERLTSIDEIKQVREKIDSLSNTYRQGKIFREGAFIALVGKPNVGKSSLLNALLQENRAIVSPHPGTTRDTLEEKVRIKDTHINIIDSAGLRNHPEAIEEEGIRRTLSSIKQADLILIIFDRSQPLDENDELICREVGDRPKLVIINKCDLIERWTVNDLKLKVKTDSPILISLKDNSELGVLINTIYNYTVRKSISESTFITRERHRTHLVDAATSLGRALDSLKNKLSEEFIATDLNIAMNHLAAILGKSVEEELLDQIFNSFCIGK